MKVNVLLFSNFETLDAFGPVEILGHLPGCQLEYYSVQGGLVESKDGVKVMTEPLMSANMNQILLLPGGPGTRKLVNDLNFIEKLTVTAQSSSFCLSICTGSALLAQTGLLDGLKATSNKKAFDWVQSVNPKVEWERQARWAVSEKYYTSSGISAGMDMTLGFIQDQVGQEEAHKIADTIEYSWNNDPQKDIFAV